MNEREIFIIASSRQQHENKKVLEAQDLYASPMFCACKEFVESRRSNWLILSDMHGLLWPCMPLAHYESQSLSDLEKELRLERALSKDVVLNTLISTLNLTNSSGYTITEWRSKLSCNTKFILMGGTDILRSAGGALTASGFQVDTSYIKSSIDEIKSLTINHQL